jgi:asparagine synthase (glutamine-hydrolysing)
MCGIGGMLVHRGELVSRESLQRVSDAMRQRGPDGAGIWVTDDCRAGLVHRRLSIIDLTEAGAQPMAALEGWLHITFNGEIYNHSALRLELEEDGHRFHSKSDTEVLLQLYLRHGKDMLHRLRGMYAFAIHDARDGSLFLARDPFGIKPLYYANDGRAFRFASQVKALIQFGGIDRSPEPAGHVGFFLLGAIPEPYTLYKGIKAVPAGMAMRVCADGRREEYTFCNILDEMARAESEGQQRGPDKSWRDALHDALLDSVRHHLVADVPVGVFLSSGIDSNTLAAHAREAGTQNLHTLTLGFDEFRGTEHDETPLAEAMARHLGAEHETRWITRQEFAVDRESLFEAMDQPTVDGVNTYFISKAAAESGLKVALSGLGGDEIFQGYPSFKDVPRLVRLAAPFHEIPLLGRMMRILSEPLFRQFTSTKYAGILEYAGSWGGAYLLRRGMFMPWELPSILGTELAQEGLKKLQLVERMDKNAARITSPELKVTALEINWYLRNQLLRDADWASMAHSLEIRVPFVDLELMLKVVALRAGGNPLYKADLARSPLTPMPSELLLRPKTGFSVPVRDWLTQNDKYASSERGLRGWAKLVYDRACTN